MDSRDLTQQRVIALSATYWAQFAIALVFVILRLSARYSINAVGLDDLAIAIAMSLDTAATVIQEVVLKHSALTDSGYDPQVNPFRLLFYIIQPIITMSIAIGRASVAILLLRLVGRNIWCRRLLYFNIVSTLILSALFSVIIFCQCTPVTATWDYNIPGECSPSIDDAAGVLSIVTSSWNALMDIIHALIPIVIFSKLHLDKKKKIGLCILMSMGVIAAVAAGIRAWLLWDNNPDPDQGILSILAVSAVELLLIIVCACTPTLKPLYELYQKQQRRGSSISFTTGRRYYWFSTNNNKKPTHDSSTHRARGDPLEISDDDDVVPLKSLSYSS